MRITSSAAAPLYLYVFYMYISLFTLAHMPPIGIGELNALKAPAAAAGTKRLTISFL
jgi:hypothetical protein